MTEISLQVFQLHAIKCCHVCRSTSYIQDSVYFFKTLTRTLIVNVNVLFRVMIMHAFKKDV
jgi:hypothetical protein